MNQYNIHKCIAKKYLLLYNSKGLFAWTFIVLLSAGSGELMVRYHGSIKPTGQLAIQVVVGGTISELGGGNFANGAITAAFSFMFDENTHRVRQHTSSYSWHYSISEKASLNKISITY